MYPCKYLPVVLHATRSFLLHRLILVSNMSTNDCVQCIHTCIHLHPGFHLLAYHSLWRFAQLNEFSLSLGHLGTCSRFVTPCRLSWVPIVWHRTDRLCESGHILRDLRAVARGLAFQSSSRGDRGDIRRCLAFFSSEWWWFGWENDVITMQTLHNPNKYWLN